MSQRKLLVGTLAILAGGIAGVAAWTYYESLDEIPAVRTYGDLVRLWPLELEGGLRVRVGMEAKTSTVGSGVLVYVLVEEAYKPANSELNAGQAGPLLIRARPEMDAPGPEAPGPMVWDADPPAWPDPPAGTKWTLFTQAIGPAKEGNWRVEALTFAGEVVRQSHFEARPGSVHPWIRWGEWVEYDRLPVGPELFLSELKTAAKLPVLFPESPDPTLAISTIEDGVSVQSAEDMVTSNGEYPLLVRIWRNGAPWVPRAATMRSRIMSGGIHSTKSLELRVWPTVAWSALPGDRLEIQVLHCPHGWVSDAMSRWIWKWSKSPELDHDTSTRLSNRVALTTQ